MALLLFTREYLTRLLVVLHLVPGGFFEDLNWNACGYNIDSIVFLPPCLTTG